MSIFRTPRRTYELNVGNYMCNKFGLSEYIAHNADNFKLNGLKVIDVGCGAGPIGLFLADQYDCDVIGVELNPDAYKKCQENIDKYKLNSKFKVYCQDFSLFGNQITMHKYDMIIANPPIDTHVNEDEIQNFKEFDYHSIDNKSFSYLTNSWHSEKNLDLLDFIFMFGEHHLEADGSIIIVFCLIDCDSIAYVLDKSKKYGFEDINIINGEISPESIGVESFFEGRVPTYAIQFVKRKRPRGDTVEYKDK